jgi:hypothetical protein
MPLNVAPSPFTAWKYVGSQLLAMMLTPIIAAPYAQLVHTIRCLIMEPGIIARSPILASQAMKIAAVTAAPTNNPIIVALSQANVSPLPNCSARRNITDAGAKSAKPTRSSSGSTLLASFHENASFFTISGNFTKRIPTIAAPPTGKLM